MRPPAFPRTVGKLVLRPCLSLPNIQGNMDPEGMEDSLLSKRQGNTEGKALWSQSLNRKKYGCVYLCGSALKPLGQRLIFLAGT